MLIEEWIQRYGEAWEAGDDEGVAALFTEDGVYRSQIFRQPTVGRQAIRDYWRAATGSSREVKVRMGRPFIDGNRVAVEWWATMLDGDGSELTLPGCLLLTFTAEGLCSGLREYWALEPGRREPPKEWGT